MSEDRGDSDATNVRRILVVEDTPSVRELMCLVLERRGILTGSTDTAEDAYGLLHRESFDAIIVDVTLPGMSGLALARLIRGDPGLRSIPILACTGRNEPETLTEVLRAGCNGMLHKPFRVHELIETVEGLLGSDAGKRGCWH